MSYVAEKLEQEGWKVYVVPEAATMIFGGGFNIIPDKFTDDNGVSF